MEEIAPSGHTEHSDAPETRPLRRILVTVALVLVALILIGVAIYTGAFIILAPMMQ